MIMQNKSNNYVRKNQPRSLPGLVQKLGCIAGLLRKFNYFLLVKETVM